MLNKYQKILIPIVVIILLLVATFLSYTKFEVANPFAVANGLIQVGFTNKQYVVIQKYPKVMLAKPDASLGSYMESQGYTEKTEQQLGSLRIFEQAVHLNFVVESVNQYFAKWRWKE